MSRDAAALAQLEHGRKLLADALSFWSGKTPDVGDDEREDIAGGLADLVSNATHYCRQAHDRAPQRDPSSPPWRDDPPAVRQFDADVARARDTLRKLAMEDAL